MGILTQGFAVFVTACTIYATLSIAYFFLSRHTAFSFSSSYQKRLFFGAVGGVISLCLRQQFIGHPDNIINSFANLPLIMTTIIGGWASGLCALLLSLAGPQATFYDRMVSLLLFVLLLAVKIWQKPPLKTAFFIAVLIIAVQLSLLPLATPWPRDLNAVPGYPFLECLCFLITYYALVIKKNFVENSLAIRDFAMIDSVTTLNNRKRVDQEITRLSTEKQSFGVGLIDVDDFKQVNDRFGHLIGDRLLFEIAGVLRDTLRGKDFVGRYGGEEFLIFIRSQDPAVVLQVCQRIRRTVANTLFLADSPQPFTLTVSIGVVMYYYGNDLMNCIHQADIALYKAKRRGKNNVSMAKSSLA
ncbi:GGDEF domain-containing protein [Martelella alba]|uniref:diguanylate cyclase n=1 Tax=Martelella alba TaxID=2590451 RepID=A0ABY2SP53_9HYPH|nr:GGDEF domain-containing protein [Martelella alba]TKI07789.1 GGDEF domain-containing protein [Martelella alba]